MEKNFNETCALTTSFIKNKSSNELHKKVIEWAKSRGILDVSTPSAQFEKTVEEIGELARHQIDYHANEPISREFEEAFEGIKDSIGDVVVTLIILCEFYELTLDECLEHAYNIISRRTGKMVNGVFVKDEK